MALYNNPNCIYKYVGKGDIRLVFHKMTKMVWIELIQYDHRGFTGTVASENIPIDDMDEALNQIKKLMMLA